MMIFPDVHLDDADHKDANLDDYQVVALEEIKGHFPSGTTFEDYWPAKGSIEPVASRHGVSIHCSVIKAFFAVTCFLVIFNFVPIQTI
jgi:hypothetical protein